MNTKITTHFEPVDTELLATVEGGNKDNYCFGVILGKIWAKNIKGLPILPADYICK